MRPIRFSFLRRKPVQQPAPATQEERYGQAILAAYQKQQWKEALATFQQLEDEGFGEASIALGQYEIDQDLYAAKAHFDNAAAQAIAWGAWCNAQLLAPSIHADLPGVDQEWFGYCMQAAQLGCREAMYTLGHHYEEKQDIVAALYWYQLAFLHEHPSAEPPLKQLLQRWHQAGCPDQTKLQAVVSLSHIEEIMQTLRILAEPNPITVQQLRAYTEQLTTQPGDFMTLSIGQLWDQTGQNDTQAAACYRQAAENGSTLGMKRYADRLAYGKGVEQDLPQAERLYRQAADRGEPTACFYMGNYTKANRYEAAYWYNKAYRRGHNLSLSYLRQL